MIRYYLEKFAPTEKDLFCNYVTRNDYRERRHYHDFNEIMLVARGAGICTINGRNYPMIRGDFYIMNSEDCHEFTIEENFTYFQMLFRESLFTAGETAVLRQFPVFDEWLYSKDIGSKKFNFAAAHYHELEPLALAIAREFESHTAAYQLRAKSLFIGFLIQALRYLNISSPPGVGGHDLQISKAIDYIHRHSHEKITIAELAGLTKVSANYFGELFRKETGVPVFDYIGRVRIERARRELENTDKTISEIAIELGFCDASYFANSFHKYTGMYPRAYRGKREKR